MSSKSKIYVILCCTKIEQDNKTKLPIFGSEATMGWYNKKEKAFSAVINNYADIHETIYNYAIIEEVEEGLHPCSTVRWIFKYNKKTDMYEEIPEPQCLKPYCGIVI